MRAIRNATNHELEWIWPRLLSDEYELHIRDGELLAKLAMHGSNSADAVSADGSFRFQRKGLFKTQTFVHSGDARANGDPDTLWRRQRAHVCRRARKPLYLAEV